MPRNTRKPMTAERAVRLLKRIERNSRTGRRDWETAHHLADDVLCALLQHAMPEVVEAYNLVPKWYA